MVRALLAPPPAPAAAKRPASKLPEALRAFIEAAEPGADFEVVARSTATTEGERSAAPPAAAIECPSCGADLARVRIGGRGTEVDACAACGGLWLDVGEIEELVQRPLVSRPDLGEIRRQVRALRRVPDAVVYRRCPRCDAVMTRRNFGRVSGVIVDECGHHGLWLDAGELESIRRFVAMGGLELELEHRLREVREAEGNRRHRGFIERLMQRRSGEWRP